MYMHSLSHLIEDLYIKHQYSIIWIAGDFNLPNIRRLELYSVVNNAYPLDICNSLIDMFNIGDFSQLVLHMPTEVVTYWIFLQPIDPLLSNKLGSN